MSKKNNYRILVVDDMPTIHQDFRKILAPESYENYQHINEMKSLVSGNTVEKDKMPTFEFEFALQSDEGVALVKKAIQENRPFALAFIDIQMPPGDDGVVTISKIWEIDHEIQTVICTAYSKYSWLDLRTKFGDSDRLFVLKKPFDNIEVLQLACSLCKKWDLKHQSTGTSHSKPKVNPLSTMERLNVALDTLNKMKKPPTSDE